MTNSNQSISLYSLWMHGLSEGNSLDFLRNNSSELCTLALVAMMSLPTCADAGAAVGIGRTEALSPEFSEKLRGMGRVTGRVTARTVPHRGSVSIRTRYSANGQIIERYFIDRRGRRLGTREYCFGGDCRYFD